MVKYLFTVGPTPLTVIYLTSLSKGMTFVPPLLSTPPLPLLWGSSDNAKWLSQSRVAVSARASRVSNKSPHSKSDMGFILWIWIKTFELGTGVAKSIICIPCV